VNAAINEIEIEETVVSESSGKLAANLKPLATDSEQWYFRN